jgi:solute carrier family 25 protein 38
VNYANTAAALVHIARTERLPGLFSGLGSTILRDAPFSGLYLLMYTRLKRVVEESKLLPPTTPPYAAPPAPPTLYVVL